MTNRIIGAPYVVRHQRVRERILVLFRAPFVPGPFSSLVMVRRGVAFVPPASLVIRTGLIKIIRFIISLGTPTGTVPVPNVIGLQESAAITAITSLPLFPAEVYLITPGGVADQVIAQTPAAGTIVNVNTTVTISIVAYLVTPNVVGLTQGAAITALVGFRVISVLAVSSSVPAGDVISQSIAPGTLVTQGLPTAQPPITITVSSGPAFAGYTLGQALAILANAGFVVDPVFIYAYSDTVPWNYVIGQLPDAGDVIKYQSIAVQLTVSMGPPNPVQTATVPSLVGMQLLDAIALLSHSYLNVGVIQWELSDTAPINSVMAQSIAAGTVTAPYTGVWLTVCSGPLQTNIINTNQTTPLVH